MPTGYTSKLYDGKDETFPEFVMSCARAFGALITMRDDAADAPIPDEFAPSDYHVRELHKARVRLAKAKGWSFAQVTETAEADYQAALKAWQEGRKRAQERRERYEAMLADVEAWKPPTAEHAELKKFMADQLTESIRFDCSITERDAPERVDADLYRQQVIDRANRDIEYHGRENDAEIARAEGRTAWVRALRASLNGDLMAASDG